LENRYNSLEFDYGPGVFGPEPEMRRLDTIRPSLRDPNCSGPDPVYGIAMDIGREVDRDLFKQRMLLYGAVVYAGGSLGSEPVRSQGHVHVLAAHSGCMDSTTPECGRIRGLHGSPFCPRRVTASIGKRIQDTVNPNLSIVNHAHTRNLGWILRAACIVSSSTIRIL
jgi:glucose-6-phosphate isomerase